MFIASLVAIFALASHSIAADAKKTEKKTGDTMTGYVVDQMCSKDWVGTDNATVKPAKHTKKCALEEGCAESGYGLWVDGKYYKFDADGSAKAKELIEKTSRKDAILVDVTGKQDGETIAVTSIKEAKAPKADKKAMKKEKAKS